MRRGLPVQGEILVVDDAPESRQLLADLLSDAGYKVCQVDNGERALFEALARPPDLILLDIRMPGMDGFEVCRRLKAHGNIKTPVVFISVQDATEDQVQGFRLGAVDFISKPYQPEEVLARVGTHVGLMQSRKLLEAERAHMEVRVKERTQELQSEVNTRRLAEERLHIYQHIFETTGECMYITDTGARLLEVNPAYCRTLGYNRNDVIGLRPSELNIDTEGSDEAQIWRALRERGHWAGEFWDRRSNGEMFPKWLELNVITDLESGVLKHYAGVFSDISALKHTQEQLHQLAYHDALTGLANRTMFRERLSQEISVAKRYGQRLAVMFIDLDKFKSINDSLGHDAGDRLLVNVAEVLRNEVREGDIIARLGGDEFMLVLRDIRDVHLAAHVADKLVKRLNRPFIIDGETVHSGASIGVAIYPDDGCDVSELSKRADAAMYRAKAAGRGQFHCYSAELDLHTQQDLALQYDLRYALKRQEFVMHFQPQMALDSANLIGAEALIRWCHPVHGMVAPDRFIPMAEESGQIVEIGYWVIREACRHLRIFNAVSSSPLSMSINLSPRQFQQASLADEIARIVAEEGVPATSIELEITETTAMADADAAAVALHQLASHDFSIAIDDFGTGYSSLSYLMAFPVEKLKIDRSFVKHIPGNANDSALVSAVIKLAKSLGLRVVAEGVETVAQRNFLAAQGCDLLQGYWYSKPLDCAAFIDFIGVAHARQQQAVQGEE
ncbi:EAL domain-containing response regulator [Pseudomonas sp. XS1P51]